MDLVHAWNDVLCIDDDLLVGLERITAAVTVIRHAVWINHGEILDKGLKDSVPKADEGRRDKKGRRGDRKERRSSDRREGRRDGRRFDGREAKPEVKPATTRVRKAPKAAPAPAPVEEPQVEAPAEANAAETEA